METGHPQVKFDKSIRVILKEVASGDSPPSITARALTQCNALLNGIASVNIQKAIFLTGNSFGSVAKPSKTISQREIQSAVKLILPGDLGKHAITKASRAIVKYTATTKSTDKDAQTRAQKAGLFVSVARVETLIRAHWTGQLSELAPVYLAAVLEYLMSEILELSKIEAREHKRSRITIEHMRHAMEIDEELSKLNQNIGWSFFG
jgi:histone H3/H4